MFVDCYSSIYGGGQKGTACYLDPTMSATATPKADTDPSNAPKLSLNKQIVLEEDEYTEGLSRIIARDFFPTLHHLTAANDYLTALESRDPSLIDASVRTLRDLGPTPIVSRPRETPIDPRRNTSQSGPNKRRKRMEDEMGLDEYQAWFTSEDNASFTEILEDENRKRRERFKWAWEAQRKAMDGKMIEDTNRQRMLLEGTGESDARGVGVRPGVRGRIAIEKPEVLLITQGEVAKSKDERKEEQEAMEEDDADESQHQQDGSDDNVMAPVKDSRPINVSTWNFKTRNNLMFLPDADQSPYHTEPSSSLTTTSTSSSTTLTEGIRQPKSITHSATRLPSPPPESSTSNSSAQVPPSPSRSRINAAIAGVRYISSSGGDDQGGEAEGPNGYNYVPSLPSVSPDQLGPLALKELMTMGTLLSTPRLLSSSRDAGGEQGYGCR
ncbi:hypothetical protein FRC20_007421 [Serendipita sp. 405]|nr:hypothetical protein FRC20_007421 [Serendipita sp. 405]